MDTGALRDFNRKHFTQSAYRWERLPIYEVASDGNDYGRYLAGEATPAPERKRPWLDRLASERARGLNRHRVRLLHDPLHDYERYECEWGYAPNAEAGEDIRVLRVGEHQLPTPLVDHDYWLLDDIHPVRMHYADTGEFIGATLEPDLLELYRSARGGAWSLAEPFTGWWERHPELHRDAPGKVA